MNGPADGRESQPRSDGQGKLVDHLAGMAGTDTVNRLYQALALVLTMVAVAATIVRILHPGRPPRAATEGT